MAALAIEVERLVKRFGDLVAVDGIDLSVPAGTCLGLLGPNGAGKTTTVEILEGLQPATSGSVRVLGRTWDRDPEAIRNRIGVTLQETRFHEKLTVEETLTLFRSFYRSGPPVETALSQVDLGDKRGARVVNLLAPPMVLACHWQCSNWSFLIPKIVDWRSGDEPENPPP